MRPGEDFAPVGEPVPLISSDVENRGWEQLGDDHVVVEPRTEAERLVARVRGTTPYIEGAWMTERMGTYYLQYAAPGTPFNTYADGYCTASSPLGPFTYSPDSPFSSKSGGFITGAGHGSTFQDRHGNWWHAATMRICVNDVFERRVGLFPAGFDDDGVLFCNQNFADYPMAVPDGPFDPWTPPPWMLLSCKAEAAASSSAPGHDPARAVDEPLSAASTSLEEPYQPHTAACLEESFHKSRPVAGSRWSGLPPGLTSPGRARQLRLDLWLSVKWFSRRDH